jgi:hypothetical protein
MRNLVGILREQGWTIERGSKHDLAVSPDGTRRIPLSRGARAKQNPRAMRNYVATFRRAGVEIPHDAGL